MITRRSLLRGVALSAGALALAPGTASAAAVEPPGTDDGGFGFGESLRPWSKSWMGIPLPDNAAIDPNSAAVGAEIQSQVSLARPILNVYADSGWTAEPIIASKTTPLVPVTMLNTGDYHLAAQLKLGVPIPAGTVPPTAGEPTLCIWQPDYITKYGAMGRYYELYKAKVDTAGNWSCSTGAIYKGVNDNTNAHSYVWTGGPGAANYATDPDSTYTSGPFTTGSGLPYMGLLLTVPDMKRGCPDHVLGLEAVRSFGRVWPATRSDGTSSGSLLREGDRYRFPPGYQLDPTLHPIALVCGRGAIKHGWALDDMSGSLGVRAAPSVASAGYLGTAKDYEVFDRFPFRDLIRLDATNMSDTNQTPTA